MLKGLKQFIPPKVCLKCDGCCRFREEASVWRPRIAEEEIKGSREKHSQKVFSEHNIDEKRHILTVPYQDLHICHFFNPPNNTCGIYHMRPLECQLYPFLLIKNHDDLAIGVHLLCPFIQEAWDTQEFEQYVRYLNCFFGQDDIKKFLQRNCDIINDYSGHKTEWEHLFSIEGQEGE